MILTGLSMFNRCSNPSENYHCRGRRVHGFIQPRLLLLLAKKPAHGYELMDALSEEDNAGLDPGNLYRTLRGLEEEGMVSSSWDTNNPGPARRVYQITSVGFEHLHAWVIEIRNVRRRLDEFLVDYEANFPENRSEEHV
jgi:poly-beta-hydroxybutyrate-responsive repressor